jgi:hypothetical protein
MESRAARDGTHGEGGSSSEADWGGQRVQANGCLLPSITYQKKIGGWSTILGTADINRRSTLRKHRSITIMV